MASESRKYDHLTQNQKLHQNVFSDFFSKKKNRPSHLIILNFEISIDKDFLSFTVILRAIANSADKNENLLNDNDLRFSIQLFSCWDFKIANRETADNKIASIATGK